MLSGVAATLSMNALPPGWKRANLVTSYTLSSMMIQFDSGVACLATSARVYTADMVRGGDWCVAEWLLT